TRAVVLDATASEVVDASLDWLMSYFRQSLMREMKTLTSRRVSAGYGDFLMENQKSIYSLLMLNRLGISLTHSHILIPEKSVTAVAGIREIG
ncbi:MAG: methionine synthase, partial [Deltaproteobacteria bacterium]|nr:methionine synthase [Deltaproteobacteria bacterium]